MAVTVVPSSVPHALEPLSDELLSARVGGATFAAVRCDALGEGDWEVAQNAWLSRDDIAALRSSASAILSDAEGNFLAKLGSGKTQLTAGEGSFFVRYSWDLLEVNAAVLAGLGKSRYDGEVHPAANVDGVLIVGEGTRVLPGVFVEGMVVVGKNCKIGPNCYIRGATTIGDDCHVGQSVEIKNSILGNKTNVGHLSYVGDSVLGDGVNFGAGTTTSNLRHDGKNHRSKIDGEIVDTGRRKFGTIVGDGVHTGIHTAIYPGRKFGAGATTLPNATVTKDVPAAQ